MVLGHRQTGRDVTAQRGVPVWAEGGEASPRRAALPGECSADVAIVGAGFTGLWAAYYLLKEAPAIEMLRELARALLQTQFGLLDDLRIGLNCLLGF